MKITLDQEENYRKLEGSEINIQIIKLYILFRGVNNSFVATTI